MAATFTALTGGATTTPAVLTTYLTSSRSRTVVHDVAGSRDPLVSLKPVARRTGRHELLYTTEAAAAAAVALFTTVSRFQLVYPERSSLNMTFVLNGDLACELMTTTGKFRVTVDYQETGA